MNRLGANAIGLPFTFRMDTRASGRLIAERLGSFWAAHRNYIRGLWINGFPAGPHGRGVPNGPDLNAPFEIGAPGGMSNHLSEARDLLLEVGRMRVELCCVRGEAATERTRVGL